MDRWPWISALALTLCLSGCPGDDDDDDDSVELPPEICNSRPDLGDGPWFTEVTDELGLGIDGLDIQGAAVATADIDGDRWPDLYLSKSVSGSRDDPDEPAYHQRLLRNEGGTSFADTTFSSGFTDTRDGAQGRSALWSIFGDVDNDGDQDAFSATFFGYDSVEIGDRSEVLLNDGAGNFTLGPEGDFSADPTYDAVSAATMFDHDHDGTLDLFVGHYYARYGYLDTAGQDSLYEGDGEGGFDDVTADAGMETESTTTVSAMNDGLNHRPSWGASACDIDGDGWTDILSDAYGRQFNMLWHAGGDGTYEDIGRDVGFASDDNEDYSDNYMYETGQWNDGFDDQPFRNGGNSAASICGDLDNDGDLDLLQIELRHEWAGQSSDMTELLYNDGVGDGGEFQRPGTEATGLQRDHDVPWNESWNEGDLGGTLFDFDMDGQLDALITSSDYPYTWSLLWRQKNDGTFKDETDDSGLQLDRAHGVALVDYDRDGDHDVLMGTSAMRWSSDDDPPYPGAVYAHLFRNDIGQDGNRLMIHLEGGGDGGANRDAFGARIVATAGDDTYVREVVGGHALTGQQNDPLQIIGTEDHCTVDRLEIRWPDGSGSVEVFEPVRANYVLVIRQGQGIEYLSLDEYVGG